MALAAGTKLNSYEILAPLGAGGMGLVHRARDTRLGRDVAVKVLPDEFRKSQERLARFEREARLLASLNHPGIASIHGLEECNGVQFLVMELVEGETLAQRLTRGSLSVGDALPLFRQIAEALDAAHGKGVVHRDLKPANIQITPDGIAKLLDFGLAKALSAGTDATDLSQLPTMTRERTQAGILLGTPAYMSPEQVRGKAIDKRIDVWAYGCCLYEALAGRAAFLAETVSDTLARILEHEPDWNALPAGTPNNVRHLLKRCLEKDPAMRLRDIGDALYEIEQARARPKPENEGARRRTGPSAVVYLLWFVAGGIIGGLLLSSFLSLPSESSDVSPPVRVTTQLRTHLGVEGLPAVAVSPDGLYLAYVSADDDVKRLWLRSLEDAETAPVPGTEGAEAPFFSPDSQWIGFFAGDKLKKVAVHGGAPFILCDVGNPRGASWSPDGRIYYPYSDSSALFQCSESGGARELVASPDPELGEKNYRWPDVLPGGRALLMTIASSTIDSFDDASVAVLDLDTGKHRVLLRGGSYPRYVPTGHVLYARAGLLLAVPFDLRRLEFTGPPIKVLDGIVTRPLTGAADYGVSRNGVLAYARGGPFAEMFTVAWFDRQGNPTPLPIAPSSIERVSLSPGGDRIALDIDGANAHIWIYDVSRGVSTRLTSEWSNVSPVWTPDGKRLTFFSARGAPHILWKSIDGSSPSVSLFTPGRPESWTPDSGSLIFTAGGDVWVLSLEGGVGARPLWETPSREQAPRLSPDGRWLAYISDESGGNEVYVQPYPGLDRRWQVSTDGGWDPRWAPAGKELFYRTPDDGFMSVEIETEPEFKPAKPKRLFVHRAGANNLMSYDVARDGERFLMLEEVERPPPPAIEIRLNWPQQLERPAPKD